VSSIDKYSFERINRSIVQLITFTKVPRVASAAIRGKCCAKGKCHCYRYRCSQKVSSISIFIQRLANVRLWLQEIHKHACPCVRAWEAVCGGRPAAERCWYEWNAMLLSERTYR